MVEVVTGTERLIIHADVYSDTLFVDTTVYPSLVVVKLLMWVYMVVVFVTVLIILRVSLVSHVTMCVILF